MNIDIRTIDSAHRADINIPNEPFPIFGRLLPAYVGGEWSWTEELFDETTEMRFPDENYDFDELSKNHLFLGAYDGDRCVGLAIFRREWNRYMYLYDLKVSGEYRKHGVGRKLIDAGMQLAEENGYLGLWLQAQDNNLAACRFYLKTGFRIRGIDTWVYHGTKQEDKSDVYFYRDALPAQHT